MKLHHALPPFAIAAFFLSFGFLLSFPGFSFADSAGVTAAEKTVIPVLCYHRFGDHYPAKDPYAVTPAEFKQQLEIIKAEGFEPITAGRLAEGLAGKVTLPAKPLVITVDDGYKDFVSVAKPLLQAYHYPATLFVYTCFVNSKNGLTQAQLKQLQSEGFEIGSHTATHPKLTKDFNKYSAEKKARALREEIVDSRQKLREWSGGEVTTLAYPYGLWDREVAKIAFDAGFQLMFTVNPGTNDDVQPKESLNRIMILRGTREKTFRAMLNDQPLEITAWDPPLGGHVAGPVNGVRVTLSAATLGRIDPATLQAKLGSEKLSLDMHPSLGQVAIRFAKPWTHGTNLLVLTAKGRQGHNSFKNSWLMIVDPPQKGK